MEMYWQATKNFIIEKTDPVHNLGGEVFKNAKNSLSELSANANTAIEGVKNPAVNVVQQAKSQTVDSLRTNSEKAKHSISQLSHQATDQMAEITNKAQETILQAENMMKTSVGDIFQKTESFSQSLVDMVQANINNRIDSWLNNHPIMGWLVSHPGLSLILLVIVIVLMFGLFQAMGSLIKDAWLVILTSPFKFFRSSLQWSFQSIFKTRKLSQASLSLQPGILSFSPFTPKPVSLDHQPRLTQIYQRLDEIRQEEHQLLEELKTLVGKL